MCTLVSRSVVVLTVFLVCGIMVVPLLAHVIAGRQCSARASGCWNPCVSGCGSGLHGFFLCFCCGGRLSLVAKRCALEGLVAIGQSWCSRDTCGI